MGSLGSWPRIAWSRHAIRMLRDRNLGLISVLRDQIGSYNELNCWVAPSPMHLSRVVLDLAEGDILLLCSRPCSFAYQISKALMVWVTLNDRLFKQLLHPSMHTSGCHTTLISELKPKFLQLLFFIGWAVSLTQRRRCIPIGPCIVSPHTLCVLTHNNTNTI